MDRNPYTSPTALEIKTPTRSVNYFFRVLAIGLWGFALFLGMSCYVALNIGKSVENREKDSVLFWSIVGITAALPIAGLILLGFASWLRHRWLAVWGVAAFVPVILLTLAAWLRLRW
jgi:hypothetical protein